MIAVKRLQSLFWVLLVALGALGAYLVSLRVATERNELMHVRTQIASARADIRYLETEFAARSSIRQLEKWNADDFRYSARVADQYLSGERALAHLDGMEPNGPAYVAPPVMVAMIDGDKGDAASGHQPVASPAALQIRSDATTIRAASAEAERAAPVRTAQLAASVGRDTATRADSGAKAKAAPENALARKAERMAMLDARLLDERTLGDIGRRAAAENGGSLH